jgi:hypothetical protein
MGKSFRKQSSSSVARQRVKGTLLLVRYCAKPTSKIAYRIVEAHAPQSEHSKALAIFPRTMEIFDMAGIAESISLRF